MEKSAEKITVKTSGGLIHITQDDSLGDQDGHIVITADQVVQLIEWLRLARDEIMDRK